MTAMMYVIAPMMLGKPMDVAAALGGILGGSWMLGMLMHLTALRQSFMRVNDCLRRTVTRLPNQASP